MAQLVQTPTSAGSGYIYRIDKATWSDARNGAGEVASGGAASGYVQGTTSGGLFYVQRIFLSFDTSSIPSNTTIDSVTLVVTQTGHRGAGSTGAVVLSTQASPTALAATDYQLCGTTLGSNTQSMAGVDGTTTTFTFNSTGLGWIVKNGATILCIRDNTYDIANVQPSALDDANIYIMTAAKYPTLTVNYTLIPTTNYLKERYHNREDMGGYSLGG